MKFQRFSFSFLLQLKSGNKRDIVSRFILLDGDEGVIEIISQSGCLGLHMCKILFLCTLPK